MGKPILINLVLAIILLLLIFLAAFDWGEPEEVTPNAPLSAYIGEEVHAIKIIRQSEKILRFKKVGQLWFVYSDSNAESKGYVAKQQKIKLMLELLNTEVFNQFEIEPKNLAKFELDKPRVVVFFNEKKIAFGSVNRLTLHRYINIGSTIFTVSGIYYPYFIAIEEDYISQ